MQKFVMCQTRELRAGGPLCDSVRKIQTEEAAFALLDQISAKAAEEGDYTGALFEKAIQRITSYHNPVVNEAIGRYCTGVIV